MTVIVENSNESTTVVDLPHLSANFPPALAIEVARDNIVNTLRNLVADSVYAATIEGPEGIGKTTVLSQFVRRYNTTAVSIFLTAANRLSYDPDLIRTDISVMSSQHAENLTIVGSLFKCDVSAVAHN